jgi:hypothetical protein
VDRIDALPEMLLSSSINVLKLSPSTKSALIEGVGGGGVDPYILYNGTKYGLVVRFTPLAKTTWYPLSARLVIPQSCLDDLEKRKICLSWNIIPSNSSSARGVSENKLKLNDS